MGQFTLAHYIIMFCYCEAVNMSQSGVSPVLGDPVFQWAAGHTYVGTVNAQVARCTVHYHWCE